MKFAFYLIILPFSIAPPQRLTLDLPPTVPHVVLSLKPLPPQNLKILWYVTDKKSFRYFFIFQVKFQILFFYWIECAILIDIQDALGGRIGKDADINDIEREVSLSIGQSFLLFKWPELGHFYYSDFEALSVSLLFSFFLNSLFFRKICKSTWLAVGKCEK